MPDDLASARLAGHVVANSRKPLKSYWRKIGAAAKVAKSSAGDSKEKNQLWAIQTVAGATEFYLDAYRQMARGQFLKGWCTLEHAEHGFARLEENPFVDALTPLIRERAELVGLWQMLFPYRHFISPAMRYKRWSCSICGKQSSPVDPCGHIPLKVYDGELCVRTIHEAVPLEISIVTDPVQKYSVIMQDYDYSVVQYVLDHLTGPFHPWSGGWTHKRHPHAHFLDRPKDGPCPCSSKLRYGECCLLEDGVRLPHFEMEVFSDAPRAGPREEILVLRSSETAKLPQNGPKTFRAHLLKSAL